MKNLSGKVAVITGAGSGIGRALALQMAAAGARLALNDWNESALADTLAMLGKAEAWGQSFDVAHRESVYAFAEEVAQRFGQVDIVVNNAGITLEQRMLERTGYEDFERIVNVNMWGMIYGSKAFLPGLRQRPEAALVNVSSIFGVVGYPNQGAYVTAKFAIRGFTETLRVELAKSPITVTCVHPGGIKTNIARNITSDNPKRVEKFAQVFEKMAITSAEEAARQILEGIQKKKKRIVIGPDARRLDWFARLFPSIYERFVFKGYDVEKYSAP
jgi:butyryl-CoA dehydrogenase